MEVWIGRDGERHGPYGEEEVRQWLRSGQISRDDLGWYEGLADWQPLAVLFRDALPDTPPFGAVAAAPLPATTRTSLEDYAGFWKRVAAYIIDAIVLYLPGRLIEGMFGGAAAQATLEQQLQAAAGHLDAYVHAYQQYMHVMMPAQLIAMVIAWLYFAACESSAWQGTLGKLALGVRVTDMDGRRIGFARATGRFFAKYLSAFIFLIGFLMVAWTRRKQGLHDLIANTLVLNGRASAQVTARTETRDGGSFNA